MKKIIVLVVALAVLLGLVPWGIGRIVQGRVDRGMDTLVEAAPYVVIVDRKWHQGWFRSEQDVTFEVLGPWLDSVKLAAQLAARNSDAQAPRPALAAQPMRFTLHNVVLHGPVLWQTGLGLARIETTPVLSEIARTRLMSLFGTAEPVRIVTRVGFFGGGTTTFSGDGREVSLNKLGAAAGDGVLSWGDFKLSVGMAADLDSYQVDGKQPMLAFSSASSHTQMRWNDVVLRGSGKRIIGDLYEGDASFTAARMHLASAGAEAIDVEELAYALDMGREGDFLSYGMQFGSGKVQSGQLSQMGLQLKQVHYDLTVRQLHLPTMAKLMTALKASYSKPGGLQADPALQQAVKASGVELLKHNPELVLDRIGIVTPEGEGYIKGVIKLVGVTDQDVDAGFTALLDRVDADVIIEVDRGIVEKARGGDAMANEAIDAGYARRDGNKYVSRVQFHQGVLTVNGKAQGIPGQGAPPKP